VWLEAEKKEKKKGEVKEGVEKYLVKWGIAGQCRLSIILWGALSRSGSIFSSYGSSLRGAEKISTLPLTRLTRWNILAVQSHENLQKMCQVFLTKSKPLAVNTPSTSN
jgi:hypothetical protein